MSCCPPGSIGFSRTEPGEDPFGTLSEISVPSDSNSDLAPLPLYTTTTNDGSSSPTHHHVVVVFSDVYGMDTGNHKAFCDTLAQRLGDSTTVLSPDLFRGDPLLQPLLPSLLSESVGSAFGSPQMLYKLRFHYPPSVIEKNVKDILLPYIRATFPPETTTISCVGFCFGGWVVGHVLASFHHAFGAGVGIHPSFDPEHVHGGTPVDLAQRIALVRRPLLLLVANNDTPLHPDSEAVEIMKKAKKNDNSGKEDLVSSILFEDMVHGWVSRGDGALDTNIAKQQEKAVQLTVEFLQKYEKGTA